MTKIRIIAYCLVLNAIFPAFIASGQEKVGHTNYNPFLINNNIRQQKLLAKSKRTTAASLILPFFEDFNNYNGYPAQDKWTDFEVYINNTMGVSPIERGVATMDGLNENGIPYDSFNNANYRYADSLTSKPINLGLSLVGPGDSIYFSFFYQSQGNGFYPMAGDSLMLYFRTRFGEFVKVWSADGPAGYLPFQQVMIPITDSIFFDSSFQFRFVNIAALDWSDADWNLDYIRLDKNRFLGDTAVNDIGFASDPSPYLNDYTSMPYRQFYANPASERSAQYYDSIRNNYPAAQEINFGYTATLLNTHLNLHTFGTGTNDLVPPKSTVSVQFPVYTTGFPPPGTVSKVVVEQKYFMTSLSATDPMGNDTIVKNQVFDNYLAYDDGSAEKSIYLNLFPPDAGRIAIEYHLNQPDTMRGMAIYFGRQVPFAGYKSFSLVVYSALKGVNGAAADNLLYEQDLYSPGYADTINHFWYYTFDNPLILQAGTFFAGTIQPAESSSDSLYFGLDVNRVGDNHAFFNVVGTWQPSLISGAIMMRPLLGQAIQPTLVIDIQAESKTWTVTPNPAKDNIQFQFGGDGHAGYYISDLQGRIMLQGKVSAGGSVDISSLTPGLYLVRLDYGANAGVPQKIIKL